MRALLISEKPSLMREVQGVYKNINFKDLVDFVALHGHVVGLNEPGEYDQKWQDRNVENLPISIKEFKYHPLDEEKDLVRKIAKQIKDNDYDYLINCCDPEREGQNIFYSLYTYLGLKLPVKRLWVNDLNEPTIKYAWEHLRDDQNEEFLKNLTTQALCRSYSDWLVGMNFSRAMSSVYKRNVAVGRVMSVVERMLADRELAIQNYKPSYTYDVKAVFSANFEGFYSPGDKPFTKEKEAAEWASKRSKTGTVKAYSVEQSKENAPLLFSLGELQSEANKVYGYTLQETLNIAQNLYEKKITTYPRTDCPYIPDGDAARMPAIVSVISSIPTVANFATVADKDKIHNYAKSKYTNSKKVKAHGAIIFTGASFDFEKLTKGEKDIAVLVAKRILATLMPPVLVEKTKAIIDIDGFEFHANGSRLIDKGWSILYDRKFTDIVLPKMSEGQAVNVDHYETVERQTTCPPRYNDSTLIKAMMNAGNLIEDKDMAEYLKGQTPDQSGIGTPATRAAIVEKLLKPVSVGANSKPMIIVERKGKSFYMTEDGLKIAEIIKPFKFSSPLFSAEWEKKFEEIQDGSLTERDYMNQMDSFIAQEVQDILSIRPTVQFSSTGSNLLDETCPLCGGKIKNGKNYYICENFSKDDDGCRFIIGHTVLGAKISEKDLKSLVSGEPTRVLKMKKNDGTKFEGSLYYDKENKRIALVKSKIETVDGAVCPCCGGKILSSSKFYYCENYSGKNDNDNENPCHFAISKDGGLDDNDIIALCNGHETKELKRHRKDGSPYSAKFIYDTELKQIKFVKEEKKYVDGAKCPACGGRIVNTGKYFLCENYGKEAKDCKIALTINDSIDEKTIISLCRGETVTDVKMKKKDGTPFTTSLCYNPDTKRFGIVKKEFPLIKDVKCPLCGGGVKDTGKYYICENYKNGNNNECEFLIGHEWSGAEIDVEELKKLIEGESVTKKLKTKDGKKYTSPVMYDTKEKKLKLDLTAKNLGEYQGYKCDCGGYVHKKEGPFGTYYECSDCHKRVSETISGHKMKKKELEQLFSGKDVGPIHDFKSSTGKTFSGTITIAIDVNKARIKF